MSEATTLGLVCTIGDSNSKRNSHAPLSSPISPSFSTALLSLANKQKSTGSLISPHLDSTTIHRGSSLLSGLRCDLPTAYDADRCFAYSTMLALPKQYELRRYLGRSVLHLSDMDKRLGNSSAAVLFEDFYASASALSAHNRLVFCPKALLITAY